MQPTTSVPRPHIAIACGGTGGHLFPGLAVAQQLMQHGCAISLVVSPKEVDQEAVKLAVGMEIITLPAIGLRQGGGFDFARGFVRSYRAAKRYFKTAPPKIVLGMGGFTSAPPLLAARSFGARTFLHESNTIPGRANRWLAPWVNQVFIGFPSAADRLRNLNVTVTGTPVRAEFQSGDAGGCRAALGLDPSRPVLLIMGGSQGAGGINQLIINSLRGFAQHVPQLQVFHLAGRSDAEKLKAAYRAENVTAIVRPFFDKMEVALGAATVAVSRAGASSLAELAAMRVPAVLVPYPSATDNHQYHNARAFSETGAAYVLEEAQATPEAFTRLVAGMLDSNPVAEKMRKALAQWHSPRAAQVIAERMLAQIVSHTLRVAKEPGTPSAPPLDSQSSVLA